MRLKDVLDRTDWGLLSEQKAELFNLIMNANGELPESKTEALEGLVSWIDAIQDAADAEGYPVVFLGE